MYTFMNRQRWSAIITVLPRLQVLSLSLIHICVETEIEREREGENDRVGERCTGRTLSVCVYMLLNLACSLSLWFGTV